MATHPGVRIDLRELPTGEQLTALLRGELDVGFVRGADADPRLHVELFAREPLLIALHRDHRAAGAVRVPLASLAHDPWVLFPRAIAPRLHEQVIRLCRQAGFTPNVVQESREVYTTVGLVGAGVGVTIVPETVRRMSRQGVVYKTIPRASVRLSMVRPSGTGTARGRGLSRRRPQAAGPLTAGRGRILERRTADPPWTRKPPSSNAPSAKA